MSILMPALAFVVRVKEDQERTLYVRRALHVGIRRDWSPGTKVLLVKKDQPGDLVMGSAVLEKIVELEAMDDQERKLCLQNNWYGRMVFERVERFLPPLPVRDTSLADTKPALLHGLEITEEQADEIERLVASRIVS